LSVKVNTPLYAPTRVSAASASTQLPSGNSLTNRPCDAVIRVYDSAGNMIETRERKGDFKEP
jgi:hypothetical protein